MKQETYNIEGILCKLTDVVTDNPSLVEIVQKLLLSCIFDEKSIDCIIHFISTAIFHDMAKFIEHIFFFL